MGFADLFIVKDNTSTLKKEVKATVPIQQPIVEQKIVSIVPSNNINGEFKQDLYDSIIKQFETVKTVPGNYIEYLTALKTMVNIPISDEMKIQTVFATLSSKGVSVDSVLLSISDYIVLIENEEKKFNLALQAKKNQSIDSQNKAIENNENSIKLKSDQIMLLTKEITELQQQNIQIKADIEVASQKLVIGENSFKITINKIVEEINYNVTKIKTLFNK